MGVILLGIWAWSCSRAISGGCSPIRGRSLSRDRPVQRLSPWLAAALAWGLGLGAPPPLAVGLILVGCPRRKTAARGDLDRRLMWRVESGDDPASTLAGCGGSPWLMGFWTVVFACGAWKLVVGVLHGGAGCPLAPALASTRTRRLAVGRTFGLHWHAGVVLIVGQHCGQPTEALLEQGRVILAALVC